jgi:serine/threonine protein phosphatase PrpC
MKRFLAHLPLLSHASVTTATQAESLVPITAEMQSFQVTGEHGRRPTDDELDYFGLTHEGKVRKDNQDHFLLATVHPQIVVHGTSLPDINSLPLLGSRLGTFALVADGVGGAAAGSDAARLATESIARYVSSTLRGYHEIGAGNHEVLLKSLRGAALQAHDAVRAEAASRPQQKRMATTLTMVFAVWPWAYVVQVGDSRCYIFQNGRLRLVTRDQTIGQQLVDEGAMAKEQLDHSPLKNVLSSAIGADEATPEVTPVDVTHKSSTVLLCSDGLTKHVSDDEIGDHLANRQSSAETANALLNLAMDRGGSDNITIVIAGRRPKR